MQILGGCHKVCIKWLSICLLIRQTHICKNNYEIRLSVAGQSLWNGNNNSFARLAIALLCLGSDIRSNTCVHPSIDSTQKARGCN